MQQQRNGMVFIFWAQLPWLVGGLFTGRILSEWLSIYGSFPLGWFGAGVITAVTLILAQRLQTKWLKRPFYPFLFLLLYVFYPTPNPEVMLLAVMATAVAGGISSRWSVVGDSWRTVILVAAISMGGFLLYVMTLAPDVLTADNGEFQYIAATLGVAHPPGFPLYTMLAHLMTRLPIPATPAYKVNLLSAITSTLTLIVVYLTVYKLSPANRQHGKRGIGGLTAVVALATATTFWAQATTANIRSLTALFAALMLWALINWHLDHSQKKMAPKNDPQNGVSVKPPFSDRWLILFALALGLGISHHASLIFMGLIFGLFVLMGDPAFMKTPRRWLRPLLALLLGLLPLLYLPLRGLAVQNGQDIAGATAGLATWDGFINHALALGFRGDFFYFLQPDVFTPAILGERFRIMGNVLLFQFSPILLIGMIIGFILLLRHDRRLAFLLGGAFVLHSFITATYRAPQTVEYMIPAYVVMAILLGYSGNYLIPNDQEAKTPGFERNIFSLVAIRKLLGVASVAILLTTALWQGWRNYPSYAALNTITDARDYAQPILQDAPPNSLVLADWHWATPLWYLQMVEGLRPDLEVRFVYPTDELYAATWARRIEEGISNGRSVIATHYAAETYHTLPVFDPLGEAFLFRQTPYLTLPDGFTPLDITLGDTIHIRGYDLATPAVASGHEAILTVAWQPLTPLQSPTTLFAHLIGFDGQIYAQQDLPARPQPEGLTLTQLRFTPRLGALPGDFSLAIGAYSDTPLLSEMGEARTSITTLAVTPMNSPPATQHATYRPARDGSRTLIGYDWDNTLPEQPRLYLHWQTDRGYVTEVQDGATAVSLPPTFGPWGVPLTDKVLSIIHHEFYVPLGQGIVWIGEPAFDSPFTIDQSPFIIPQIFRNGRPILRDLVVSVRLIGYEADGHHWNWWDLDDTIPAMGAIPTLKWIAGSQVRSPHFVTLAPEAYPTQTVGATVGLYDAFTERPLPILDERITAQYQWIPLGQTNLSHE